MKEMKGLPACQPVLAPVQALKHVYMYEKQSIKSQVDDIFIEFQPLQARDRQLSLKFVKSSAVDLVAIYPVAYWLRARIRGPYQNNI